jgi:hypothetical protein
MADMTQNEAVLNELNRIAREMKMIREHVILAVHYMREAESEIPEKMRRFVTYMHDAHDICYMYEERGHQPPEWLKRELERCDDRYRQLLRELNLDGGVFEKIRREMAGDAENRWDHTRLLTKPQEKVDETRQSESGHTEWSVPRPEDESSEPSSSGSARGNAGQSHDF